ncbi:hypothetical protein MED121_15534 [Marinomonas sp. MED121]|uniref:DUF2164 domain-containing protein n=1 Tax=Marinomonas sp. MED121 TaxID=314277 RepID=UPI000069120B|nr:DUF2164 domain-containing protein [Marinomonas sp. MED121]EAQ67352.1 hypothetical protein MED121_15534 [Marinomonas sp. MED121]
MSKFSFTQAEKDNLIPKLKQYMSAEFELDLGGFEAEFLLDFIAKEFGSSFYNKGLQDAQAVVLERMEVINEEIYALEK